MKKSKSGFTLIELVIVIGIALTLFGFITLSLTTGQRNISVNAATDTLISDISSQQTKAVQGEGDSSHGIFFEEDKYILFRGDSYSPTDPENFEIKLGQEIIFSDISFLGSQIVFTQKSGEVSGFSEINNVVTISDAKGQEEKTIQINSLGVITQVN